LYHCISTGLHGPTCIFWANPTPFTLQRVAGGPATLLSAHQLQQAVAARRGQCAVIILPAGRVP
jgi:hypothetical protein